MALPGFEERVAAADLTIRRIKRFATRHAAELHDENRYVGVWVNGPTVYLDVSEVVVDQVAARTMGRARNQIALHAFAPFQVIWPLTEQVPA